MNPFSCICLFIPHFEINFRFLLFISKFIFFCLSLPFRYHVALLHFGESPNLFSNIKVSTLIALFKEEANAQSIFTLIFERICRDINDKNVKVLDELYELLREFDTNELSEQKILLEIAVLVVGDLSKDKKNRIQCDRFREILFEIIKTVSKDPDNGEWLIGATLPAFVIIVKAYITANKSNPTQETDIDEQTIQLIKLFLKNSVRFSYS